MVPGHSTTEDTALSTLKKGDCLKRIAEKTNDEAAFYTRSGLCSHGVVEEDAVAAGVGGTGGLRGGA